MPASNQLAQLLRELADSIERNELPAWLTTKLRDTAALASQWKRRSTGILCNQCLRDGTFARFDDLHALHQHGREQHGVSLAGLPLELADDGVTIRIRTEA